MSDKFNPPEPQYMKKIRKMNIELQKSNEMVEDKLIREDLINGSSKQKTNTKCKNKSR